MMVETLRLVSRGAEPIDANTFEEPSLAFLFALYKLADRYQVHSCRDFASQKICTVSEAAFSPKGDLSLQITAEFIPCLTAAFVWLRLNDLMLLPMLIALTARHHAKLFQKQEFIDMLKRHAHFCAAMAKQMSFNCGGMTTYTCAKCDSSCLYMELPTGETNPDGLKCACGGRRMNNDDLEYSNHHPPEFSSP